MGKIKKSGFPLNNKSSIISNDSTKIKPCQPICGILRHNCGKWNRLPKTDVDQILVTDKYNLRIYFKCFNSHDSDSVPVPYNFK